MNNQDEKRFNIGDEIKIINAGIGALGCNGRVGYVTEMIRTCGLAPMNKGFNVLLKDKVYKIRKGDEVWRVALDGEYELIKTIMPEKKTEKPIPKQKAEILIYDRQSFKVETLVRDTNMNIIDRQQRREGRKAHKCIYNGLTTIVILSDGSKGIAKCHPKDTYNKQIGYDIAYCRAMIKSLEDELNFLCENAHLIQITKQVYEEFKKNFLGE